MFSRAQRLARADFALVERGARSRSAHFSLSSSPRVEGYAVVVAKSVAKRSVDRHRVKRRVLAALKGLPLPPSLVVHARAGAPALTAAEVRAELAAALGRLA